MARLSVLLRMVHSMTSKLFAMASKCKSSPASSKSEFVRVPNGFSSVIRASFMCCGHSSRHTIGWMLGSSSFVC